MKKPLAFITLILPVALTLIVLSFNTGCLRTKFRTGEIVNSIGMEFVHITSGTFVMGSSSSEKGMYNRETQHRVTLTKGFYMQTTEVTQGQWYQIMGTRPWSEKKFVREGDDCPAVYVSWNDCQEFIRRLNHREDTSKYRLPTEAEWEYACRAGSTTRFCFDNSDSGLANYCWYKENTRKMGEEYAQKVGAKKPNAWDIYDMHGNVWEWCQDWYSSYPSGHIIDPEGPPSALSRVIRGGGWYFSARDCRSANRYFNLPAFRDFVLGFRLARSE